MCQIYNETENLPFPFMSIYHTSYEMVYLFVCLFVDSPFRNKVSVIQIMVLLVLHCQGQTLTLKW